jgi:hypothetical protein
MEILKSELRKRLWNRNGRKEQESKQGNNAGNRRNRSVFLKLE